MLEASRFDLVAGMSVPLGDDERPHGILVSGTKAESGVWWRRRTRTFARRWSGRLDRQKVL